MDAIEGECTAKFKATVTRKSSRRTSAASSLSHSLPGANTHRGASAVDAFQYVSSADRPPTRSKSGPSERARNNDITRSTAAPARAKLSNSLTSTERPRNESGTACAMPVRATVTVTGND